LFPGKGKKGEKKEEGMEERHVDAHAGGAIWTPGWPTLHSFRRKGKKKKKKKERKETSWRTPCGPACNPLHFPRRRKRGKGKGGKKREASLGAVQ